MTGRVATFTAANKAAWNASALLHGQGADWDNLLEQASSGSGKSTLIRHINRLIEPTAGGILIEGQDINALSQKDLQADPGREDRHGVPEHGVDAAPHGAGQRGVPDAPQDGRVDAPTSRAPRTRCSRSGRWSWPTSGDKVARRAVGRHAAARGHCPRALLHDPAILLMDEPFSHLDPLTRRQLQDKFMAPSAEMHKTTLFITHDLDEAIRIGDRIAIMKGTGGAGPDRIFTEI